ncbi:MAG: hypothetical protein IKU97_01425 [Tidjanibacter sp.]|nr:hypothetical protein [Tidjanibacter sp.]
MKKLAIIPILFFCFTSCVSRVVDWHHITIPSFVYDYRELNEEVGWQFDHNELRLEYVTPWESRKVVATLGLIKEKYATPESREAHRKLSNKHNDCSYNHTYTYYHHINTFVDYDRPTAYSEDFVEIRISSNSDYDQDHLKGSSLADITTFVGYSYKEFIDSGYTFVNEWLYGTPLYHCKEIHKMVNELTIADLTLLASHTFSNIKVPSYPQNKFDFALTFNIAPTLSQQHTLEIVFVSDEGKEFRFEVDVDFAPTAAEIKEK